jgi:NADPH:quinone reductase-like Zn-dependent oxidoreductase
MSPENQTSTQKALALLSCPGPFVILDLPIPKPGPGEIITKVISAALNPVDWKISAGHAALKVVHNFPAVLGEDIAGTVHAVGEGVTNFKVGDRVLHSGLYMDTQTCGFQHYAKSPADLTARIPDNLTFDQAATIPLCFATAAIGLYSKNEPGPQLTAPWEEGGMEKYKGKPMLVIGGSSSVGQYAIQLAKLSGFHPIITTSSPKHHDHLKSIGATHTLSRYLAPLDLESAIVSSCEGVHLMTAFDAISDVDTQQLAYAALTNGGTLVLTQPGVVPTDCEMNPEFQNKRRVVMVFGAVLVPANHEFGTAMYEALPGLLANGSIKVCLFLEWMMPEPIVALVAKPSGDYPGGPFWSRCWFEEAGEGSRWGPEDGHTSR